MHYSCSLLTLFVVTVFNNHSICYLILFMLWSYLTNKYIYSQIVILFNNFYLTFPILVFPSNFWWKVQKKISLLIWSEGIWGFWCLLIKLVLNNPTNFNMYKADYNESGDIHINCLLVHQLIREFNPDIILQSLRFCDWKKKQYQRFLDPKNTQNIKRNKLNDKVWCFAFHHR